MSRSLKGNQLEWWFVKYKTGWYSGEEECESEAKEDGRNKSGDMSYGRRGNQQQVCFEEFGRDKLTLNH